MKKLKAIGRALACIGLILPVAAAQMLIAGPLLNDHETLIRKGKRSMLKILGVSVAFNGAVTGRKPTVFAANHMSYIDILLLGAHVPGVFVAKAELKKWPLIGWMARSLNTIFTTRQRATLSADQGEVVKALNNDLNVILFPEGKTGSGEELLPFRAGLLGVAFNNSSGVKLEKDAHVQPVSIRVTHVDGRSVAEDPSLRSSYAWWGPQSLISHFWKLVQADEIKVELTAHPLVNPEDFSERNSFINAVKSAVHSGSHPESIRS